MKYLRYGALAVVAAALLWSLDGLLRRQLFDLPATVIIFWEHLLGLVILAPYLIATRKSFRLSRGQWGAMAIVALLSGAVGTIAYTSALLKINFIPFSVVVLLQQLQPLFAIAAAALLLREPVSKRFIGLGVVALAAAYALTFPDLTVNFETGQGTMVAALLAVVAAASWGSSTALSKHALTGTSFMHVTGVRFALTPIFALLIALPLGHLDALGSLTPTHWQYLVAITVSTGLVALGIYYFGLQRVPASRSTLLELTWPLSAALVGFVFFDERLSATQVLGAIVLVAVMYFIAQDARRIEEARHSSI